MIMIVRAVQASFVVLAAGALLPGAAARAQDTTILRMATSCAGCRIEVRQVATLTMPADSAGYPHPWATVMRRGPTGGFVVAPLDDNGSFAMFSSAGRFERTVGRPGRGPGEYVFVPIVRALSGDSLLALDAVLRRLAVLTPNGDFVRSLRIDVDVEDVIVLPDRRLVLRTTAVSRDGAAHPFRLVSPAGEITASFGSSGRAVRPGDVLDMSRAVAWDGASGIWSSRLNRYELEHWQLGGTRTRTLVRTVDWFPAWQGSPNVPTRARPLPQILGIQRDAGGLLWVFTRVPDPAWKPAAAPPAPTQRGEERATAALADWDGWVDMIVEVIDPVVGEVLVSQRLPELYTPSRTAGLASRRRDHEDIPDIAVFAFTLVRP